jgi:hypothetical protein
LSLLKDLLFVPGSLALPQTRKLAQETRRT